MASLFTNQQPPTPGPPAAPPPPDPEIVAAVAEALGTDPTDLAATAAAVVAMFSPYAAAEAAAFRKLTASERAAVRGTPGASALRFLAARKAFRGAR